MCVTVQHFIQIYAGQRAWRASPPSKNTFPMRFFCFSFNCVENVLCSLSLFNRRPERRIGGKPCQREIKKKKVFWATENEMNCTLVMALNGLNYKITILKCFMEGDTGA